MSWLIKCYSKKDYKKVKNALKESNITFKQKEKKDFIEIDVCFPEEIYDSLDGIKVDFTLFREFYGIVTKFCTYDYKNDECDFYNDEYDDI